MSGLQDQKKDAPGDQKTTSIHSMLFMNEGFAEGVSGDWCDMHQSSTQRRYGDGHDTGDHTISLDAPRTAVEGRFWNAINSGR